VVTSGEHSEFGGRIPVFSAHSRVDLDGVVHYFAKGSRGASTLQQNTNSYGRISREGEVMNTVPFMAGEGAPPAFLHDMFITSSYSICVDHSLRADAAKMATTGYFEFDESRNVRLGVLPRDATESSQIEWYDTGLPGFVWHCVSAREEGDRVTCWMPIFEEYTREVPIHLAHEPESYLWKVEINTKTKTVDQVKRFDHIGATERCATNDDYIAERPPRYAYLMMRGQEEMYSGVAKFDMLEERLVHRVSYGEGRFGGEAYFQPRPGSRSRPRSRSGLHVTLTLKLTFT